MKLQITEILHLLLEYGDYHESFFFRSFWFFVMVYKTPVICCFAYMFGIGQNNIVVENYLLEGTLFKTW